MNDDDAELYNKSAALIDGDDFAWIRIIHKTHFMTLKQLCALILYALRKAEDQTRDPKKGFVQLTEKIVTYINEGQIEILDHHTHLPTQLTKEKVPVVIYLEDANWLFDDFQIGVRCSELVKELFKEKFPKEAEERKDKVEQNKESKEMTELRNEVKRLKTEIKSLKTKLDSGAEIITGFAKKHYPKFDPLAGKNMARSEMLAHLEEVGFKQDPKTLGQFFDEFLDLGAEKARRKSKKT